MSSSHRHSPPPLHYRPTTASKPDAEHHTREWTSGTRGGGKVPADLEWGTNPKQAQEELGANLPDPK